MIEYIGLVCTILGGVYALSAKHLMRGVLGLALFFTGIATLFGHMGAWFLAVGQIFLFVGGVVTLFVLAFNFTHSPIQEVKVFWPLLLSLGVISVLLWLIPDVPATASAPLELFAGEFFAVYGWMLNLGILLLFSAVITAQYLLEETV